MTRLHLLDMEVKDEPRMFRAVCTCGWTSDWLTTNRCMGRGRRHVIAARKGAAA